MVMILLHVRLRKNTGRATPPATGGFRVIRGCALALALVMAVSTIIGLAPSRRSGDRAVAQSSPPKSNETDTMVKDVVTLDSESNSLNGKLAELDGKSESLSERIKTVDTQIASRRERLAVQKKALAARARSLYVNGRTSTLVMLVSSTDVSDFFSREEMLQKVAERDAQFINGVKKESEALRASVADLRKSKREIDQVTADLRAREQRLQKSRTERAAVLAKAGANSSAVVAQTGKVEAKIKEINPPAPNVTGRPTGKVMTMVATAYSPQEPGLDDHTASGMRATRGVVAVDPRVIPLGTRLNVEGYGNCIAGDTGSAIKGNRIDVCFDTLEEMNTWGGYRTVRVEILD
jgi:3D (Asp-Asp-Asp) domain-containing protein/peptidoglycan hydrolase CwlO-like protein